MDHLRGDISQTFIKTNTKGNLQKLFCNFMPKKMVDLGGTGQIRQTVFEGISLEDIQRFEVFF